MNIYKCSKNVSNNGIINAYFGTTVSDQLLCTHLSRFYAFLMNIYVFLGAFFTHKKMHTFFYGNAAFNIVILINLIKILLIFLKYSITKKLRIKK